MTIVLGSTSNSKLDILKSFFADKNVTAFESYEVDPGITDQPLDEPSTVAGSINRGTGARALAKSCDIAIGMEGGLSKIEGLYHLLCAVAIIDRTGKRFVGISKKLPLPTRVSQQIDEGKQFGLAVRNLAAGNSSAPEEVRALLDELISRKKSFTEALETAWFQYQNSAYFSHSS